MLSFIQIKTAITDVVNLYPIKKVSLFGSYADGTATETSDIDIMVEFSTPNVSLFTLLNIKYAIEEILQKHVDLIHAPIDDNALIKPTKVIELYEQ